MLIQFIFSNFRSFEGKTVLDMRASGSKEMGSHVRQAGNDKVLPVAVIYGANASGKSNVLNALDFMRSYVILSFNFSEEDNDKNAKVMSQMPFAMSDSKDKPSEFEVYYVDSSGGHEKYYNYGFVLDQDGICEEWLKTNSKTGVIRNSEYSTVFYRQRGKEIEFSSALIKYSQNLKISLDERVLLVSLGAKLKVKELIGVRKWFWTNTPLDCSDFLYENFVLKKLPNNIIEDDTVKDQLLSFMHSFDDSIVDFEFEKIPAADGQKKESYRIFTSHEFVGSGKRVRLSFEDESSGTIKMFSMYQTLKNTLKWGSVLFVDELDIKLHPLLMRNIILTFSDPEKNPNNAQLVFTTHNTIYMDMGLLRRDEIWFTEKKNGVSELYSLDDIVEPNGTKIRKDANYEKNYLLGNYGAVPYLSSLLGGQANE